MTSLLMEPVPVAQLPPNKPPKNPVTQATDEWPNDEDMIRLRMIWTDQSYAGYTKCARGGEMAYCYGMSYEKKICFPCFIEKSRPKPPKRSYTKRKKT